MQTVHIPFALLRMRSLNDTRGCALMAAERRRGYRSSSSPEAEASSAEATPITLKLGADDVRKLKETVNSFSTVLGTIDNELPGPSCQTRSERKGGIIIMEGYQYTYICACV